MFRSYSIVFLALFALTACSKPDNNQQDRQIAPALEVARQMPTDARKILYARTPVDTTGERHFIKLNASGLSFVPVSSADAVAVAYMPEIQNQVFFQQGWGKFDYRQVQGGNYCKLSLDSPDSRPQKYRAESRVVLPHSGATYRLTHVPTSDRFIDGKHVTYMKLEELDGVTPRVHAQRLTLLCVKTSGRSDVGDIQEAFEKWAEVYELRN